jgi:alkaline phosphatase
MKSIIKLGSLALFIITCCIACGHPTRYTSSNAHSHNDYLNSEPFYRSYKAGFGSIEADVYPVSGALLVAHKKEEIEAHKTLDKLYLTPLRNQLATDATRRLNLLIDIKEDYQTALPLLVKSLEPLTEYLSTTQKPNQLTILISGTRPKPSEYENYPAYIFFDDDFKLPHTAEEWTRVGLVSLPFDKISAWKGVGPINRVDEKAVRHKIDSVHGAGKPIRFWAAPDTEASWSLQKRLHVDLIGTDMIDELSTYFLRTKK